MDQNQIAVETCLKLSDYRFMSFLEILKRQNNLNMGAVRFEKLEVRIQWFRSSDDARQHRGCVG